MQMNKPHSYVLAALGAGIKSMLASLASHLAPGLALSVLSLAALAMPAIAQETVNFNTCVPIRVTEPFNFSGTNQVVINASIAGGSNEVDLSVSGLPAGATGVLSKTAITNSSSVNLNLSFSGVAEGTYTLSINATNAATNTLFIPLQIGDVWSGGGGSANMKLSNAGNWNGGIAPGPNDDVVIGPIGSQTNVATNIIVDINTTLASLRFATTNSTNAFHTMLINPGVTLSLTGSNGFSLLRDYISLGSTENITIAGGTGTMVVSNETANFTSLIDNSVKSLLDMSKLGTFQADVNRLGLGDCFAYPNYTNIQANGFAGKPKLYIPTVNLGMTNIIKAVYVDPYNYTNGTNRAYGLELGNDYNQATSSSAQLLLSLGVSNLFLLDGFCISGFGATIGSLNFNTNFASLNPTAYFRNTDGISRMSMFCIADAAGPVPAGANTKANSFNGVDFASNHGFVNALVNQFIMSRDHPNSAGGGTSQAQMDLGQGIFDVNTAFLGYQTQGDQTNTDYCQAILIVSNTATFRVNNDLELGYTTADLTDKSDPGSTYGQIAIGPGGTVQANQIGVGGTTKASGLVGANDGHGGLNQITLKTGALLVVSNNIADATPNGALGLLSFGGTSTLELFINAANTSPYVYVNSLTTTGTGNTIQIGSIDPALTLPAQVKLISYAVGTPTFAVSLPSGYSGAIINNGAGNTIDVYITVGAPKSLAWRGYVNNNWDSTTRNWLDLNTGLHTNFANLDNVAFDDTASVPTSIALQGLLIPGTVLMTNSINSYTLNGPGTTSGSATLTKIGTANLDVEATTTLSINMTQGKLTGSGTINSATISPGATLLYSGTINAGIICGGTGVSSGTINGIIDVQNGGVFTNLNSINGPLTLETNSFMNNAGSINNMFPASTVATNAFLLNMGSMNDNWIDTGGSGTLTVNGTFEDTGSGTMTLFRVTISPGAIFIPGGGTLATTILNSDGQTLGGRLTLSAGSTTYIEINPTNSQPNTRVNTGAIDYGPSQSAQSENGCTLVLTNISNVPLIVGDVFKIFGNAANGGNPLATGTATNSFPILIPAQPGSGMIWDFRPLWPGGSIGIVVPPIVTMTNSIKVISTNIVVNLSWPASQAGWVVQQQQNPPGIGLSNNWGVVVGSQTNLSLSITNPVANTNTFFYRMAYP
jgi:hypothetical protein